MTFWTDHRINKHVDAAHKDAMDALKLGDYRSLQQLSNKRSDRAELTAAQLRHLSGHSFFSTNWGRVGLATPGCKPGDKICLFYGGHPLYIIRPHRSKYNPATKTDDKLWEFVGTAYVPHLMDQHIKDDARQGPDQIYTLV